MSAMRFNLLAQDGAARRGRLAFARGTVETPAFMPVGTYGTVKAMTPEDLEAIGAEIVLGNTFHLYLRPGLEVIQAHRGLHRRGASVIPAFYSQQFARGNFAGHIHL
jgi:queuine tRNA-ribosyltransferase